MTTNTNELHIVIPLAAELTRDWTKEQYQRLQNEVHEAAAEAAERVLIEEGLG